MKYFRGSLLKQAESTYDQRQKLRDEKLKSYVDSEVMKAFFRLRAQEITCSQCSTDCQDDLLD